MLLVMCLHHEALLTLLTPIRVVTWQPKIIKFLSRENISSDDTINWFEKYRSDSKFSPTAREGNVFRSVCQSFCRGDWLPSMHQRSHDRGGLHPGSGSASGGGWSASRGVCMAGGLHQAGSASRGVCIGGGVSDPPII